MTPIPGGTPADAEDSVDGGGIVALIGSVEAMTARGQPDRASDLYQRWLGDHPADPLRYAACFNHGVLLLRLGHAARAEAAFAEAVLLNPAFPPARINAGLALERLGHLDRAMACWLEAAAPATPDEHGCNQHRTTALKHVARVFKAVGHLASAEQALRRCLDIDPHQRDAAQHWLSARQIQCKWPALAPWGSHTRPSLVAGCSPLGLAIETDDPMLQLANAARSFEFDVPRATPHTAGRWVPTAADAARTGPLRIGYVSPDLREHAVGFLTAELFELHDRARVEVFAYYSGRTGPDPTQARFRRAADHWRDVAGWDERQVARQIVGDGIDILVDLGGHTGDAPTAAFARRPAPVIVNWLGYPGSMGTPHHQYIIADDQIIPEAYERYYSERVVRLPCYQPTDRKRVVAGPPPSRPGVGLPEGVPVYCCFNGSQKVTAAMFRRWMAILARVPGSVLWLLSCDAATDLRLRQQAAGHGVSPDRLVFAARQPNAAHLARYQLADLFLDTFPYGAHTTASDALWMGVPVVTIRGHSFAARVCASLVSAAGLGELVCDGPDAYVDRAVELGTRPERLLALRERLVAGRDRCTLFDTPLLTDRLESLYRRMWREFAAGEVPEPDLSNLALYQEIGGRFDADDGAWPDLAAYQDRYALAVAYRDSVSPVPPDRRLWAGSPVRPPP